MAEIRKQLRDLKFGWIRFFNTDEAILASTTMGQLIAVPYISEAGSNPREFQGMKSTTNKKILQSFLKNHDTIFWALHSGVSITVTNGGLPKESPGLLQFEDACLTNGLQTVTIGRILTLIKAYQLFTDKDEIHTKINRNVEDKWRECIDINFPADAAEQLNSISLQHVNSVLNWLHLKGHEEYLQIVNSMTLESILNSRLSIKVVLLDKLSSVANQVNGEADLEGLGDEIAEANNETQKVDPGDLFGTGNREWLKENLPNTLELDSTKVKVELRRGAEDRGDTRQKVIHVLDLLRAILPTTFIVDIDAEDLASFVASYANRREPIYNWFSKVIRIHQSNRVPEMQRVVRILHNLTHELTKTMLAVHPLWDGQRKGLSYELVNDWTPLKNTSLSSQIFHTGSNKLKENADNEIRTFLNFSFANLFPIFVFATRTAIEVSDELEVRYVVDKPTASFVVTQIYMKLAIERLAKTLGSTSNLFRNPEIYRHAENQFKLLTGAQGRELKDCTAKYRVFVS